MSDIAQMFTTNFIVKSMQDRVAHEWKNKPSKLHERICHSANEIFNPSSKGNHAQFSNEELCFVLRGGKPEKMSFKEAMSYIDCGNGVLVVSENGDKFLAETESSKGSPYETYSGS